MAPEEWKRQAKGMEAMVVEAEGKDDRVYVTEVEVETKKDL